MKNPSIPLVVLAIFSSAFVAACGLGPLDDDSSHAQAGHYSDAGASVLLGFLNDQRRTTFRRLDEDCALRADVASNLVIHRDGPDARVGSDDDDLFDTVEEVDGVGGVGPATLEDLFSCAEAFARASGSPPVGESVDVITDFSLLDPRLFAEVTGSLLAEAAETAARENPDITASVELESVSVHHLGGAPIRYDVDYVQVLDADLHLIWRVRFTLDAAFTLLAVDTTD